MAIYYLTSLGKLIADIVNDPIVNNQIKKYDFDLLSYYKKADKIQRNYINSSTLYGQVFIISSYVKKTLDMSNIKQKIKDKEIKYNQWLIRMYPQLIPISKKY